jgi:hypothetical protein
LFIRTHEARGLVKGFGVEKRAWKTLIHEPGHVADHVTPAAAAGAGQWMPVPETLRQARPYSQYPSATPQRLQSVVMSSGNQGGHGRPFLKTLANEEEDF